MRGILLTWTALEICRDPFQGCLRKGCSSCADPIRKCRGWNSTKELLSWQSLETLVRLLASLGTWSTLFNWKFFDWVGKKVEPIWWIGSFLPFPMETWSVPWYGCTLGRRFALLVRWWVAPVSRNQESGGYRWRC